MRSSPLLISLVSSALVVTSSANDIQAQNQARGLAPPRNRVPAQPGSYDKHFRQARLQANLDIPNTHAPIMNVASIALPSSGSEGKDDEEEKRSAPPPPPGGTTISDVLPSSGQIGIFSSLTRDIASVSKRLDDGRQNSTMLAPTNSVMKGLPRKPWEDSGDYEKLGAQAYVGAAGEDRAHQNLRRFVEAHIVPESPWEEGKKVETMEGGTVWWESKDGKKVIQPGGIEIDTIVSKVSNGEVWILKGIVDYSR